MKTIVFTCLTSFAIAVPAFARCDDNVSYMVDAVGRCVNLTKTTQAEIATQTPIVISNLRFSRNGASLLGTATNRSNSRIGLAYAEVNFFKMINGQRQQVGGEKMIFLEVLEPGKSATVEYLVNNPRSDWRSLMLAPAELTFRSLED